MFYVKIPFRNMVVSSLIRRDLQVRRLARLQSKDTKQVLTQGQLQVDLRVLVSCFRKRVWHLCGTSGTTILHDWATDVAH